MPEPIEDKSKRPDPLLLMARLAVGLAADFLERAASIEGAAHEAAELMKKLTSKSVKSVDFNNEDFFTVQIPADKMRLFIGMLDHWGAKTYKPKTTLLAVLEP